MKELVDNHIGIFQKFGTLAEFTMKVMHFSTSTLHFLKMNNEKKDIGKESKATHSIYGFLVEDWLKMLLDKPIKEEGVDLNREEPKEKEEECREKVDN